MKNTTRKSFPVYLSWKDSIKLLSVEEKAQFLDNLFNFNSGEEIELNTPMLTMFWKSIEYNLKDAIDKYDAKVATMKKNSESNSKLKNTQPRETENSISGTIQPDIKSQTIPDIESQNTQPRLYNVNDNVNDNVNGNVNGKKKIMWDDDDEIVEPYSASVVNKLFDMGKTCDNIISLYPEHSREIKGIFWERE